VPYIGQDLQVAYPSYKNIDDVSGSFNGSTTSFALLVNGVAPVPLPLNSQQCLISVGGVIQRPDDTGTEGFRLSGGNIVFSSAPNTGEDFFGVILAGADYVNAGGTYPDGSAAVPSITFSDDTDTGFYRASSGVIGVTSNNSAKTMALLENVQTFTAAQRAAITTLTDAATVTPDFSLNNNFTITLNVAGSSRTIANPTNLVAGQSGSLFVIQDGTGSRTITWGSYWDWAAGGTAPILSTAANAVDRIDYIVRSSTSIHAVWTGNYS
jgi:hypothetical protein